MNRFRDLSTGARTLILAVATVGTASAVVSWIVRPPALTSGTALLMGLAVVGGFVRVPLPVVGRLSFAYPFLFGSLMAFGPGASCLAGVLSATASALTPIPRRWQPAYRGFFNVGLVGLAASVSGAVYVILGGTVGAVDPIRDLGPILAHTVCFSCITLGLISLVIHLSGGEKGSRSLRANLAWSIPGFLAGSSLATLLGLLLLHQDVGLLLLAAPFAYLMDLAYRARTDRAEEAQRHSQQTAELYQSVTRALARAIEAKDENTEDHLQRVQLLCLGVGERLGLAAPEMEALHAAALLHDIGKIAVPEYILTKPGRLTPEEMDKMRIHPKVGAEILGAVPFPYPLAPIVRHHHERWDGNGYPDRLAGAAIPLGARILTLVDCYDALTTDRPYRKAVSRPEAIEYLRRESGRIFDPRLVEILAAHVDELEVRARAGGPLPGSPGAWDHGERPEEEDESSLRGSGDIPILQDIARTLAHQLDLDETLTLMSAKLAQLVPYRSLVVYLFDDDRRRLVARFATGAAASTLRSVSIPVGERLSGWAALHQRSYIGRAHVNPVERDGSRFDLEDLPSDPEVAELRSALVAPLTTDREQLGVLALYESASQAYTQEARRRLLMASIHFAQAVRNASLLDRNPIESLTDTVTGILNWRFFLLEADHRLSTVRGQESQDLGLLAFRLQGLEQVCELHGPAACDRLLGEIARRLARECDAREVLVRMGCNLFLVLTSEGHSRALSARCLDFLRTAQTEPVEILPGVFQQVRLRVTQAVFPSDGRSPDQLLHAVEERLETDGPGSSVFPPFPSGRWSALGGIDS